MEAFKYAGSTAGAMGYSVEDASIAIGLMSNQGIKAGQAGTSLKNIISNLAGPSSTMQKVMDKYNLSLKNTDGSTKSLVQVMDMLRSAFKGVDDVQKAADVSDLFGKESMSGALAIINTGAADYEKLKTAIYGADGAAKKMADTKLDSLSGQWTILKSAVEGMNISLGEKLAPYAKQFVTWFTGKIPDITNGIVGIVDTISKHTDDIKGIAVAIGGIVTAIGGLSVAGSIGNSIGGIAKLISLFKGAGEIKAGFSAMGLAAKALPLLFSPAGAAIAATVGATAVGVHEYNKLMDESCTKTIEDLDPIERVMNSFNGNINKSKKEMQDLGLIYDDFGSGVSDSFKTAAKEASNSILDIEMNINRLTRNGTMDESSVNKFQNYVNEFAYNGINAMKEQQSKVQSEFNKTFSLDGTVDDTEQGVLDALGEFYNTGENKILEMRNSIYDYASEKIQEHGTLLDEDIAVIKDKLAEMKSIELEYTAAENARDQAATRNQFKNDASRVTGIDGASELLQKRAEDHQKQLDDIDNNYQGTLAYYDSLLSNSDITDDERSKFEAGKSKAEEARNKSLEQAQQDWQSDLETLYSEYPNAKGMLNEETGKAFTDSEIKSQNVMQKQEDNHAGLSDITESGVYALQNSVTGNLDTMYVSVDEQTKKIEGIINGATGEIGAYSDEQKSKLQEVQGEYNNTGAALQSLADQHVMFNSTTGEVVNSMGSEVGALQNIKEAADGTVTGILNINGTPIEITTNADGTITKMQEVTDATEQIPSDTEADVDTNADEAAGEIDGVTQSAEGVPPDTPANVSTNADSAASSFGGLLSAIEAIPAVKTVTVTVKKVIDSVVDFFGGEGTVPMTAGGTDYATGGLTTVNEQGWELADRTVSIMGQYNGNPLVNLQKGTKVRNHMDSMSDMRTAVKQEVAKQAPQQKQVQVFQPQLAMAGENGGNSFNFNGVNININDNQSIEAMVQDGMIQFGKFLKEALSGIKS